MVKALAWAFRWRRMLETGAAATVREIATAEKIAESYVSRVLRLTLLAPAIVEAILDGRQASEMILPALIKAFPVGWKAFPVGWKVQRVSLIVLETGGGTTVCRCGWHKPRRHRATIALLVCLPVGHGG